MKISIVAYHVPDPEGTSAGRGLFALGSGLVALGHEVESWSWGSEVTVPKELAAWCRWQPLPEEPALRTRARALYRPRSDVVRAGWSPSLDDVALAEDPLSFPAIAAVPHSVVTFHYLTRLDIRSIGWPRSRHLQDLRAEARAARRAALVTGYSERVARALGSSAVPVPFPYLVPDRPVRPVTDPVAVLLANWSWQPNRAALQSLLEAWPDVARRVTEARLLLAGRNFPDSFVADLPHRVELVGPVSHVRDLYDRAAIVAFPCPDTSGPKIKVLEALAHGVPVVTTGAGIEGLHLSSGEGAVVVERGRFGDALADLLLDPDRRAALGSSGYRAIAAAHAPVPAARARIDAFRAAFG